MSLTVITPTGDRPEQFEICKSIMATQTLQPDQWLVVDDGKTPLDPCPEFTYLRAKWDVPKEICTLKRNVLRAIPNVACDKIIIIEDDDWYPSNYLEYVSKQLDTCDVYGNNTRRYINLQQRLYRQFSQKHYSIWSGTGFKKGLLPLLFNVCSSDIDSHALDTSFHEHLKALHHKVQLSYQTDCLPVGFKGWGVGREGATPAHSKASKFEYDTNLVNLRKWVTDDHTLDYFKYTQLGKATNKISVVVPTYNSSTYLKNTLESIRHSQGVDIEIIVVDDGSSDVCISKDIAVAYGAQFYATGQHAGANTARNIGALIGDGEYIIFCDSDTFMEPWCLKEMLKQLEIHPEASWCYCDFWIGSEKINKMKPFDVTALKDKNHCPMISLHRKADFCWLDESMQRLQDWEYWLRLALTKNKKGVYLDKPGFISIQHDGRISKTVNRSPYAAKISDKIQAWAKGKQTDIPHLILTGTGNEVENPIIVNTEAAAKEVAGAVQPTEDKIMPLPVDVVIPLGGRSLYNNLELKLALRSIATNLKNVGTIYVVSDCAPSWLQNVRIISFPDIFVNNKDANIMDKISKACQVPELSETFIFWSDDQVLLKPILANDIKPTAEQTDAIQHFAQNSIGWKGRMYKTGLKLKRMGKNTTNFDSHVPQPMSKTLFHKMLRTVNDYTSDTPGHINGYCINTLYFNLFNIPAGGFRTDNALKVMQPMEKRIIENGLADKVWCCYNNVGLSGVLKSMLEHIFTERCIYER